jgi:sialate O-acetylesterase
MIQLNFSTLISKCKLLVLFLLCFIIIGNNLFAALKLPAIFKDGMVLQRDEKITVWGWADKGASVSISFNSLKQVVIASFDGKWTAEFGPFPAGGPHELTISADISITVKNIFIGEV